MEHEELEQLLEWKLRRNSLLEFFKYTRPEMQINWHHVLLCNRLSKLRYQKGQRIIIFQPPQTGKSQLVSRTLPAFLLGHNPHEKIVGASYSADLANSFNRDVQRLMDEEAYYYLFPNTRLNTRNVVTISGAWKRTGDFFETVGHGGYFKTVGVGGSLTGYKASTLIIDDPVKGRAEADSGTIQRRNMDWYRSVATTRLSLDANVVITNTPWSLQDIAFQVMELAKSDPNASKWELIKLPAIAEGTLHPEDPRSPGQPIWPSFYGDEKAMERKRSDVGSREWNALFQCSPVPSGGNIVKADDIMRYTNLPLVPDQWLQSWDLRFSKNADANDWVVGQVWCRKGSNYYLADQVRGRWSFTDTIKQFVSLTNKWPQATLKLVENKANGPALESTLKEKIPGIKLWEPKGSKEQRLLSVQALFEAHNVWFPEKTHWVEHAIHEITSFPQAVHDDIVDTTSMALIRLKKDTSRSFAVITL